jgi:hypothetical protein
MENPFDKFTTKQFTPGGNPGFNPVASLSHLFAPVKKAGEAAAGLLSSHTAVAAQPAAVAAAPDPVPAILEGLAYNETRGVKGDRYAFSQPSGNPALGKALGKYQVTEELVNRLSPKYLGRPVTPKEYLSNPKLQDEFIAARARNLLKQGYTPQQIADFHRNGSTSEPGSTKYNRPEYVKEFEQVYQQYANQGRQ